jgi:CubicO group peptidase (beta-lactamase class C family)
MDTAAENRGATFRAQDQVWPVRVIRRGEAVRPLPPHPRSLVKLTFELRDVRHSVSDYMSRRRTSGLLILKDGEIALPPRPTGIHRGAFSAGGAFGQYIYVNPTEQVVAAIQSA